MKKKIIVLVLVTTLVIGVNEAVYSSIKDNINRNITINSEEVVVVETTEVEETETTEVEETETTEVEEVETTEVVETEKTEVEEMETAEVEEAEEEIEIEKTETTETTEVEESEEETETEETETIGVEETEEISNPYEINWEEITEEEKELLIKIGFEEGAILNLDLIDWAKLTTEEIELLKGLGIEIEELEIIKQQNTEVDVVINTTGQITINTSEDVNSDGVLVVRVNGNISQIGKITFTGNAMPIDFYFTGNLQIPNGIHNGTGGKLTISSDWDLNNPNSNMLSTSTILSTGEVVVKNIKLDMRQSTSGGQAREFRYGIKGEKIEIDNSDIYINILRAGTASGTVGIWGKRVVEVRDSKIVTNIKSSINYVKDTVVDQTAGIEGNEIRLINGELSTTAYRHSQHIGEQVFGVKAKDEVVIENTQITTDVTRGGAIIKGITSENGNITIRESNIKSTIVAPWNMLPANKLSGITTAGKVEIENSDIEVLDITHEGIKGNLGVKLKGDTGNRIVVKRTSIGNRQTPQTISSNVEINIEGRYVYIESDTIRGIETPVINLRKSNITDKDPIMVIVTNTGTRIMATNENSDNNTDKFSSVKEYGVNVVRFRGSNINNLPKVVVTKDEYGNNLYETKDVEIGDEQLYVTYGEGIKVSGIDFPISGTISNKAMKVAITGEGVLYKKVQIKVENGTMKYTTTKGGVTSEEVTGEVEEELLEGMTIVATTEGDEATKFVGWFENISGTEIQLLEKNNDGNTEIDGEKITVIMESESRYIKAKYEKVKEVEIKVSVESGSIGKGTIAPAINGKYKEGETIEVVPTPNGVNEFEGWYENGNKITGSEVNADTNELTIEIDENSTDRDIKARFIEVKEVEIKVSV